MNNLSLGDKIKFLRKKKCMTQRQLAEKIPVSFSTFRRWEKNKHYPDVKDIIRLAEILDTTITYLMEDKETQNQENFDTQRLKILNLARDIANDDIELKESITGGSTKNRDMFIIHDNNTNTEFYIPNTPDGRKLLTDFLNISIKPFFTNITKSNVIAGDNNNNNELSITQ